MDAERTIEGLGRLLESEVSDLQFRRLRAFEEEEIKFAYPSQTLYALGLSNMVGAVADTAQR